MMPFGSGGDWTHRLVGACGSPGATMNPCCFPFGTSPPQGEPPSFVPPPELPEETLLDREHNETLAKLHFVEALVRCVLELARSKTEPLAAALTESSFWWQRGSSPEEQVARVLSEGHRRAEQLVLYMRAVQLLGSALNMARQEVGAQRLRPSSTVKALLRWMRDALHRCIERCRELASSSMLAGVDPSTSGITADRLLYKYALDLCQSAAVGELGSNAGEIFMPSQCATDVQLAAVEHKREAVNAALTQCFRRYQTAQILLHSLSHQVDNDEDREILQRYKDAVEQRLFVLQSAGLVCAYDST